MTREQYDALIAEAHRLNLGHCAERWAWNQAHSRGLHPELSGIPAPPRSAAEKRQGASDWHDDRHINRNWLGRRP